MIFVKDDNWVLCDEDGVERLLFNYDSFSEGFSDAVLSVGIGSLYGAIDRPSGKEVVPVIYDWVSFAYDDVIDVGRDGKHGCMDFDGKFLLPIIYDDIDRCFVTGVACGLIAAFDVFER